MRELYMHEIHGYMDEKIMNKLLSSTIKQLDALNTFGFSRPFRLLQELAEQLQFSNPR
jgi:hypothetical protein